MTRKPVFNFLFIGVEFSLLMHLVLKFSGYSLTLRANFYFLDVNYVVIQW